MRSKNHYSTLGIDTTASQDEIRKAYRKLALKHHPDKNNGDASSAAQFKEIHEAYHILSDPQRRSAYNQKTWFHKHAINKRAQPLTAYQLFLKTDELQRFLGSLQPAEINKKALSSYIKHLLSQHSIATLKEAADAAVNREVISNLLNATESLSAYQTESIAVRLKSIADAETMPFIDRRMKEIRLQKIWERYHFLIIFLITILICIMVYILSS